MPVCAGPMSPVHEGSHDSPSDAQSSGYANTRSELVAKTRPSEMTGVEVGPSADHASSNLDTFFAVIDGPAGRGGWTAWKARATATVATAATTSARDPATI